MLNNIMYVTIRVTDQDRALEFYTERLGLEKRIDASGPEGRFLTAGVTASPVEIILWSQADSGPSGVADDRVAPWPLILESDGLRKDFEILRRRGVEFEQSEPQDYPFGVRAEAVDPDGNRIALRQPSKP